MSATLRQEWDDTVEITRNEINSGMASRRAGRRFYRWRRFERARVARIAAQGHYATMISPVRRRRGGEDDMAEYVSHYAQRILNMNER